MVIQAILFDFVGTTVSEKENVIVKCFQQSFVDHGLNVTEDVIQERRGKNKDEMIEDILLLYGKKPELSPVILRSFKVHFEKNIDNFSENPDLDDIMQHLKSRKIKVGVGTGLPKDIFTKLLEHLRWERFSLDYISTSGEVGNGRPHPDMILDMMVRLHLNAYTFLKVGDTVADIQEGKNAGVITAALCAGTQPDEILAHAKPDFMLKSLKELKSIIS